jgi:hypothetical protein
MVRLALHFKDIGILSSSSSSDITVNHLPTTATTFFLEMIDLSSIQQKTPF